MTVLILSPKFVFAVVDNWDEHLQNMFTFYILKYIMKTCPEFRSLEIYFFFGYDIFLFLHAGVFKRSCCLID